MVSVGPTVFCQAGSGECRPHFSVRLEVVSVGPTVFCQTPVVSVGPTVFCQAESGECRPHCFLSD